jgi:energy-coupling factor transporter transmembrane protein EcfT
LNLYEYIDKAISFVYNNPIIALIIAIVFFFLIYRKQKFILLLLILILILASVYYVIMDTASLGKLEKKRLIHESERSSTIDGE